MSAAAGRAAAHPGRPMWVRVAATLALLLAALVLLLVLFPWDLLRGPLNRYVSDKTGRHFEITRKLDVKLGRTTRVLADGIEFANPPWAEDPFFVQAEGAEIEVRLLPLLRGRIDLPSVTLRQPQLGLQAEADGRRSWALGRDSSDPATIPEIGKLVIDQGSARYRASHQGADIRVDFAMDAAVAVPSTAGGTPTPSAAQPATPGAAVPEASRQAPGADASPPVTAELPLRFQAEGTWQGEPFTAAGRTGNVLALSAPLERPFPAEVIATAAGTRVQVQGTVASLGTLEGLDVQIALQGANLADLYQLVGVVLPATPRYAVQGRLNKQAQVWQVQQINGKLGKSDLTGHLSFDQSQPVPLLAGQISSRILDFDDLAPLVGLPEQGGKRNPASTAANRASPAGKPTTANAQPAVSVKSDSAGRTPPAGKVLPTANLDATRLKAMNADVRYSAARVANTHDLPLDRIGAHVRLEQGVLRLEPMDLGVAGGRMVGRLRIDGNTEPATAAVKLDGRALELNQLFPGTKTAKTSFGKIHGDIDLQGRGNSVAQMLGTSSGSVAMLMGKGQISNLLLELAGLDGGEIIKFLVGGDENVPVRCAATAFDVRRGMMTTRVFVLDTTDTVIYGNGTVNLANETLDLTLHPYPKDTSILSLRSPLKLDGSFAAPRSSVDMGALGRTRRTGAGAGRHQSPAGAGSHHRDRSGTGCGLWRGAA
jgi:AsmA family protein